MRRHIAQSRQVEAVADSRRQACIALPKGGDAIAISLAKKGSSL